MNREKNMDEAKPDIIADDPYTSSMHMINIRKEVLARGNRHQRRLMKRLAAYEEKKALRLKEK